MTRPTILDMDLVVVPQAMTPEMIATAWSAWHSRHGGKIGPGPAFGEAVPAALSASPYPTAWDDVRRYVEGLERKEARASASLTGLLDALEHHTSERHGIMAIRHLVDRAEAAEARIAELEKRLADAERVISKQRDALQPLYDAVFNDNGDITVNLSMPTGEEFIAAYCADRAARAYMEGK